ncbi:gp64/disintegrin-like protein [Heterostelium album PN500]|uniref:Gp64/disintegrin-like protein n=1 Tax=Heterostelium pallidum (strain ATCC 26659 / Pp 5 / PN500) TaxID=670386 RepID=D3BND4_HETP5|nr:gp64/disintegrin-like protein [Heterostelium album PN500]EFA76794.1 gp64/disintegrin-like protein [Heterostelium album PN500]|eukprot:XP_020428926.1 gp64/disintegrin-like protein [Heterostelium album PN500]
MKLLISLVVLLVVIGSTNACDTYGQKCVKVGSPCPNPSVDPFTTCEEGSFCYYGKSPTSTSSGNCTAFAVVGEYCDGSQTSNTICAPGLSCYTGSDSPNTCQFGDYAAIGESCDSSFSCINNNDCVNGKCQLRAAANGKCNDAWSDCAFGYSCNTTSNACIPTLTSGAACNVPGLTQARCAVGLVCSPVTTERLNYTCVPVNSKGPGAACASQVASFSLDGSFPSLECDVSQSLLCLLNNGNYTCQTPPAVSTGNCSATACQSGSTEFCSCPVDSWTGTCTQYNTLGADCSKAFNALAKCAVDNKCQIYAGSPNYKSCIYQHCSSDMCGGDACVPTSSNQGCGESQYAGCHSYSSSSFVRPTTIFIALIALLLSLI